MFINKPGKQWMAGKTFDTFAPMGPELVTADEVPDPHNLGIRLRLNGQTMQDSSTRQLIFRVDEVVADDLERVDERLSEGSLIDPVGTITGTVLGLALIQALRSGLSLAGVKGDGTIVVIGLVLIGAILVSNLFGRDGDG